MGRTDRRGYVFALWLLLFMVVGSANAFYFNGEYGVVKPDEPYLFVGEDLVLFCNLTKLELLEDSTYLYFERNGAVIPSHFVDILTTRSIRLRYPIHRPQDEGHFICRLRQARQERGSPRTIGSQYVKADYSPATVNGINCTVYNWENMTCRWDLGRSYHHPEYISVSLVWTITGSQRDCPAGHMTNTSCTWVREGTSSDDLFLPGHKYIMRVVINNTRRKVIEHSQTFHIRTISIVQPSPVVNLRRKESNATCLWLVWYHTDLVHDKVAFVEYLSQWNSSHWHKLNRIHFKEGPPEVRICQLTPFTEYTIRVAVKPLPRADGDGYRSEWKYIEKVRTDPSAPRVAPEMCPGCFTEVPCSGPYCRNVIVYWKHIPWSLRRSVIHSYQLQYSAEHTDRQDTPNKVTTLYPNTSHLLNLRNDTDYSLHLYAVTSENKLSLNHSTVFITSKRNKPAGPDSLVVETEYDTDDRWTGRFDLRWSDLGQSTASFLVAWCRGNTATLKCDHEEKNQVQWQEVSSDTTTFRISMAGRDPEQDQDLDRPNNYIVGVARQQRRQDGVVVSSGLTWASCFYRRNTAPRFLPEKVKFSKVYRAGTLRVTWTYKPCDNMAGDVHVSRFIINYCVISDTSNNRCKGSEYNTTVRREARNVLLEGLEQGAYYKVSVAADSQWGTGKRSEPVYSRVMAAQQQEEPRDFTIIGVVLAVVVLIILILIGLCKLRSRFRKGQEKFLSSFGDLPSLPPDNPVKSFKDRPLPQVPPGSNSSVSVTYTSGVGSSSSTEKRQRGGKHKSITSETSLLGNEEAGNDDDNRRRHRSGTSSMSEKSKLLAEDSAAQETVPTLSKYDSDSGAESRYSSEDHDYASVEGGNGSAEEGLAGNEVPSHRVCQGGKIGTQSLPRAGYVSENKAVTLETVHKPTSWKMSEHKPAPTCDPPPPPSFRQTGYIQAALVPAHAASPPPSAVSSFKPQAESQPLFKTLTSVGRSQRGQPPAQLVVALEPAQSARPETSSLSYLPRAEGLLGSEGPTLPRRPPGSKIKQYVPSAQDTASTASVDPYASTNVTSFSSHLPPSPAPPPYLPHPVQNAERKEVPPKNPVPASHTARGPVARGYMPHPAVKPAGPTAAYSGSSTSSYSDDSRGWAGGTEHSTDNSEPIYSPPWESQALLPYSVDNRPLSEYMLKLPQNFFDSSLHVNEGPTTEL